MKRIIGIIILGLSFAGCGEKTADNTAASDKMTIDIRLKTTPVKDQGRSGLCWDYAMLATIETEHLMQGDSVNLSPDFVARKFIEEQAGEAFFTRRGSITMRGMMTTALRLIGTYGLTQYDAFHAEPDADYNVTLRKARQIVRGSLTYGQMDFRLSQLLDNAIHTDAPRVYMLGAVYTPQEFAHSVCREGEYAAYTSFTHHPFGQGFAVEVADNHYHDSYMNVPVDSLLSMTVSSLQNGHPVCWEGDVSEDGFSFARGIARLGAPLSGNVQERRQRDFENRLTTDDHCMEIMGIAHDAGGRRYFIMKNSWGTSNPYHGYMFVSFDYFKLKTIAVVVKNAQP